MKVCFWMWLALSLLFGASFACRDAPSGGTTDDVLPATSEGASKVLVRPRRTPKTNKGPAVRPRFSNVAHDVGIEFTYFNDQAPDRFFLPEIMCGGAAWIDIDLDGWIDLYLMNGGELQGLASGSVEHANRVYQNLNGTFADVTTAASGGDTGYGHACMVGDYDADGFPDLYLTNLGKNVLLHNNGDGTFTDVSDEAGVADDLWGFAAVWFDADADGDLDVFVVNYTDWSEKNTKKCDMDGRAIYCGPGEYKGLPDRLYVNQGDGTFVERTEAFGMLRPDGKGLAALAVDLDEDLKPEVYVANDMAANFLFTRTRPQHLSPIDNGDKLYVDLGEEMGAAKSDIGYVEASMGIAAGDFDRNGHPDLFVTHFFAQKNTLYRNLGKMQFEDVSKRSRIATLSHELLGFGTVAFDYDRDGWLDLIVTNGHVFGPNIVPSGMRPQLVRNVGKGQFEDVTDFAGEYFEKLWLGRGIAGGDFDNDGDLDFGITHLDQPFALVRNDTETGRHFLGIELATVDRSSAVGGRVVVKTAEGEQVIPVVAGGTYVSTNDSRLLFGLGDQTRSVEVRVYWPSGTRQELTLEVDRYWLIREGHKAIPTND